MRSGLHLRDETKPIKPLALALAALTLATAAVGAGLRSESVAPIIHRYSAGESGVFVNAYLVETARGVVAVDTTLTVSDAKALRARLDSLGKPLRAILLTHAHPDHYNGARILRGGTRAPIVATVAVDAAIRKGDAAKERQWRPVWGAEWPAPRALPSRTKRDGESVTIDGVRFTVHDLGPGESHADSYWLVSGGGKRYAFVGDVVLSGLHAYVADGHTTRWLGNLEKMRPALAGVDEVYPGHGEPGGLEILDRQRNYLNAYRAAVGDLSREGPLTEERKKELSRRMLAFHPDRRLAFFIELGADAVTAELERDRPDPDVEEIKAQVKDGSKPLTLTVRLQIRGGSAAEFSAAFASAIEATRKERGCLNYELNQDAADPHVYLLYERWRSLADLEAHLKGAPYAELRRRVGGLLTAREVRVLVPAAEGNPL